MKGALNMSDLKTTIENAASEFALVIVNAIREATC